MVICTYENWTKANSVELKSLWKKFQREFKDYIPQEKEDTFTQFCKFTYINSVKYVPERNTWLSTREEIQGFSD